MNLLEAFQDNKTKNRACPAKLERSRGFTLIEILVVMGLIILIVGFAITANIKQYTREVSSSEVSVLVSALQKARSRAMNNIDHTEHGVYFGSDTCPDTTYERCYAIFAGPTYVPGAVGNEHAEQNLALTISSAEYTDNVVVFKQLSGNPDETGSINLVSPLESATIEINSLGLIDW